MLDQGNFNKLVGFIFLIIGILHLLRALLGWNAVINNLSVPMYISWIAVVVTFFLSFKAFRL